MRPIELAAVGPRSSASTRSSCSATATPGWPRRRRTSTRTRSTWPTSTRRPAGWSPTSAAPGPRSSLTYGDDQRGYPHPDHLRVHDISLLAFDRAGDPDWYPELGEPFQPSKLYYSTWSRARMVAIHERLLASATGSRRSTRSGSSGRTRTTASRPGSTSATSSAPAPRRCGPTPPRSTRREGWWFALADAELNALYPWEDWILARSLVGPIPEGPTEDDLFAGVREQVRRAADDAPSSTASSSARRTSASRVPTTPSSSSRRRSTSCRPTDFDPTVAFMRGKLKSVGPTGPLFDLLRSGEAAAQLSSLAARP